MEIKVQLFIKEHHNGFFSLEVVGNERLQVYTDDLKQGKEDIYLVLSDRIERTNPSLQSRYAQPQNRALVKIELLEALQVMNASLIESVPTSISVIVTRDRRWQRLWFPRWNSHFWISVDDDLEERVVEFVSNDLLRKMNDHERLKRRFERKEWMELFEVEAEPPSLESFTGKMLGKSLLPEPKPKVKKEEDDELLSEEERKFKKKKKRPKTPTLKKLGIFMSGLAKEKELERAWGRDEEVEELLNFLKAPGGQSIALIGESGSGKSSLLNELVYRLRNKSLKIDLRTRPVWFVDASRLVAGDGFFGDWQQQCLSVIQESIDAEVIWYIGDLLPLLDAGKHMHSDQNVSFLLRPYLAGKRLTVIGECTPKAWTQLEIRDVGFARLFTPYRLKEPESDKRLLILQKIAEEAEEETFLKIAPSCLDAVIELSQRYHSEGSALGHCVYFFRRFLDELSADEVAKKLDRDDVVRFFCSETGMPEWIVQDRIPLEPEFVYSRFRSRLIGQEEAVRRMTDLVSMIKSGLSDLSRPLGSFLFVGPTGVGKTEMAKILAGFLFGRTDRLIRFDMSEFVNPQSVHRFLGSAQEEGKLISAIRKTPFCVLLLDEIEKAHPVVFDVLLQALGEARLTDESGRTADFRNVVILMTSNLGVGTFRRKVGFGDDSAMQFREHFIAEAEQFFRPEFFNRIDHIVPFMPLEYQAIQKITHREIDKFMRREGVSQRDLELRLDDSVFDWLAENGVEPRYGARPLKRVIESSLNAPLARHLSTGQGRVHRSVVVTAGEEKLSFLNESVSKKQQEGVYDRSRGLKFLDDVGMLRFLAARWLSSSLYVELKHEVRLLDRLSQDRNFWNDRKAAEERVSAAKLSRALIEQSEKLRVSLASIEDLAYESHYDRESDPLGLLELELMQAEEELEKLELQLFSRRFENPNVVILYMRDGKNAQSFLRELADAYVMIFKKKPCRFSLYTSDFVSVHELHSQGIDVEKVVKEEKEKAKLEKRKKARSKASQSDAIPDEKPDMKKRGELERLRWQWKFLGQKTSKQLEESGAYLDTSSFFVRGIDGGPKAIVLEAENIACYFASETGIHETFGDNSSIISVKIFASDQPRLKNKADLFHPWKLEKLWPSNRKRLIHRGSHQIKDFDLDIHYHLEARWHRVYKKFMRASIYHSMFGQEGLKWLSSLKKRWEDS